MSQDHSHRAFFPRRGENKWKTRPAPAGAGGVPACSRTLAERGIYLPVKIPPSPSQPLPSERMPGACLKRVCPRLRGGGGVSTPETWGSGRVFSSPQARRGSGSGGSGGPPSLLPRGSAGSAGTGPATPPPPPRPLLRHGAPANLLGSAILSHKEMHMAASDTRRPLRPASGSLRV